MKVCSLQFIDDDYFYRVPNERSFWKRLLCLPEIFLLDLLLQRNNLNVLVVELKDCDKEVSTKKNLLLKNALVKKSNLLHKLLLKMKSKLHKVYYSFFRVSRIILGPKLSRILKCLLCVT
ncbi:hypothetical protein JTB14_003585 [Gonioctena quinquepunctata]|nr:hypothetical protein JTB14_003585 [Gonioctena quinquepunctata]